MSFPDPKVDLDSLDIPVNAVATALKDFFSKRLPPLLDEASMAQLEDIASKYTILYFKCACVRFILNVSDDYDKKINVCAWFLNVKQSVLITVVRFILD